MTDKKQTVPRLRRARSGLGNYSFIFIFAVIFIAYYLVNASLTWMRRA